MDSIFSSLSAIAKAITGTNWNGYAFFGIKRTVRSNKNAAGPRRPKGGTKAGIAPAIKSKNLKEHKVQLGGADGPTG